MSPDARPLWQFALDRIVAIHDNVLHPLDGAKMVWWCEELYAAGERPSVKEMRGYLSSTHPHWRPSAEVVLERWSKLLRNPMHQFRMPPSYRYRRAPFLYVEEIIVEQGLEPLSDRVPRTLLAAADEFARAATDADHERFRRAHADIRAAARAVRWLRRERFGGPLDD